MLEEQRCESNCPAQSDFSPKIRWRTRKKKGLHSTLVRIFAQNQVTSKKKRSSLKFGPISYSKPRRNTQNIAFVWSNLMPNLQRGEPCLNSAYFSLQIYNPGDPKGGRHGTMPPPKYAPGLKAQTRPEKFKSLRGWSIELGICAKDKEIPKT